MNLYQALNGKHAGPKHWQNVRRYYINVHVERLARSIMERKGLVDHGSSTSLSDVLLLQKLSVIKSLVLLLGYAATLNILRHASRQTA